jgi:hypothetical protein
MFLGMKHQLVNWKNIMCRSRTGKPFDSALPLILDMNLKRTLLTSILSMPRKKAISLSTACRLLSYKQRHAMAAGQFGREPGHYGWYYINFTSWISSLGYHIELSGEEFEAQAMTQKLAQLS